MLSYTKDYQERYGNAPRPKRGYDPRDRKRDEGKADFWQGLGDALPAIGTGAGAIIGGLATGIPTGGLGAAQGAALGAGIGGGLGQGLGGMAQAHGQGMRDEYTDKDLEQQALMSLLADFYKGQMR